MSDQITPPPDEEIRPDDAPDGEGVISEVEPVPETVADAAVIPDADATAPELAAGADTDGIEDIDAEISADDSNGSSGAPVDAVSDAAAGEAGDDVDDDAYDDEYEDDEDYAGDLDESLEVDELETVPVDWSALAASGAGVGYADVPDLTVGGVSEMDVDIDAALAAVDTLGAVVAAEQERKREEVDRREAQRRADEEYRRWSESYVFRRPGMIRVQGGRVVTILPAVALMAVGAVLTLATASGQMMSWQTLTAAASAGLSVSLLSYWLASGRWARGALFAALAIAIAGAWVFIEALPDVDLTWRLPIIALGAAFALTGLLGRPRSSVWLMVGLGIAAGAVALPYLSQPTLARFGPFILAAAVILAALPAVFRTRRG